MTGRPPIYTEELAAEVLRRLSTGESLRRICRDEEMPHRCTVHEWVTNNVEGFADRYARAKDVGLDEMADELIDISDETETRLISGGPEEEPRLALDPTGVARNKLRVDTRKWYLAKLASKKYGDKQQVDLSGKVTLADLIVASQQPPHDDAGR